MPVVPWGAVGLLNWSVKCIDPVARLPGRPVSEGFWAVIVIIVAVVVYVLAKVIHYARKSERQWSEVDKSKLREWQDDEEW